MPIIGVILLLGWFLGRSGWNVTEVDTGVAKLAPPTATPSVEQPTATSEPSTQGPQISPTSAPIQPAATQETFVTTFEVFANLSWQDTGIQITTGDTLRIIWDGKSKWRGANTGDFSDPLGGFIGPNPNYACPPLMPSNEAGWNALVAKIGEAGVPSALI